MSELRLEALTPVSLDAFRALLGGPGFGGCFCAVWTHHGPDWPARCADPAQPNFAATAERVRSGQHVGYLLFLGAELVGWCGAGPKPAFPALATRLGARLTPSSANVWSLGCLAFRPAARGRGLSARVIAAVASLARASGATALEAYPTDPWDEPRSYRGALATYLQLGFQEVAREPDGESELVLLRRDLSVPPPHSE